MVIEKSKEPKGIGGWLILPTVGLFLWIIMWLFTILIFGIVLFSKDSGIYELIILMASILVILLIVCSLVFEFIKKKVFPKLVIITLWVGVIVTIMISVLDKAYLDDSLIIIIAIIFTWYFIVSKRVKNTFVK